MITKSLHPYFATLKSILFCKFIKRINCSTLFIIAIIYALHYICIYMRIFKTIVRPTNIFTRCCLKNLHIICFSHDTIYEAYSVQ